MDDSETDEEEASLRETLRTFSLDERHVVQGGFLGKVRVPLRHRGVFPPFRPFFIALTFARQRSNSPLSLSIQSSGIHLVTSIQNLRQTKSQSLNEAIGPSALSLHSLKSSKFPLTRWKSIILHRISCFFASLGEARRSFRTSPVELFLAGS